MRTTEAIRCYSCVSNLGGSGCDDKFDSNGDAVTIIENETSGSPCTACMKIKASNAGVSSKTFLLSSLSFFYFLSLSCKRLFAGFSASH